MSISTPTVVTREEVKAALDIVETARANDRVDRAIETATAAAEGHLRRRFSPWIGTRYFSWPDVAYRTPWRLWLDDAEVISVTSLVAGGVAIASPDYLLEPANSGPPYWAIEVDLSTASAFQAGPTRQRAIALTGLFGFRDDEEPVGQLAGSLDDDADATANVTWTTPKVGVGSLLRIGSERILVTDRTMVTSGQTLQTPLASSMSAVTVAVTDGTAFGVDEVLLLDAERMRVVDIAGNALIVKRAVEGSVLAAHSGSTIYTMTGATLKRSAQGSTLAAHDAGATIYRHLIPPLVRDLGLAYALNQLLQEGAGYGRTIGSGDNQQEASGRGVRSIEADAMLRYGRQLLFGAV